MQKHWVVIVMFAVAAALTSSLWTSCGEDSGADAGPDTGVDQCKGKASGDVCGTGGLCLEVMNGKMECTPSCNTPGDTCGSDLACYNIGVKGKNACLKFGTKTLGDTCGVFNDCNAGLACLDMGGGSFLCFSICASAGTCAGDYPSCDDSGFGFRVCVENTPEACTDVDANDCPSGYTCTDVDGDLLCLAD